MCHTLIIDNSPISYSLNRENAVPIDSYTGLETRDEALIALLPILRALVDVHDVRAVLGLQQLRL
jgi:CTD nuclear envelope phosphatase 1